MNKKKNNAIPSLSIIVPTYKEALNLPHLIKAIDCIRHENSLKLELLVMDDDSCDGTEELIKNLSRDWIKLHIRKSARSLSMAVCEGLEKANIMGMKTIAFIGSRKGDLGGKVDIIISVPSSSTPRIQEAHIMLGHIICQLVEEGIFPKPLTGKE